MCGCCCCRLLDDNRQLFVPELQETINPHPHFMLFATQNPPGLTPFPPLLKPMWSFDVHLSRAQQLAGSHCKPCAACLHKRLLVINRMFCCCCKISGMPLNGCCSVPGVAPLRSIVLLHLWVPCRANCAPTSGSRWPSELTCRTASAYKSPCFDA